MKQLPGRYPEDPTRRATRKDEQLKNPRRTGARKRRQRGLGEAPACDVQAAIGEIRTEFEVGRPLTGQAYVRCGRLMSSRHGYLKCPVHG